MNYKTFSKCLSLPNNKNNIEYAENVGLETF